MSKVESELIEMSVFPTEAEINRWESLNRVQQVEQMKLRIQKAYESGPSDISSEEIRNRAKSRLQKHRYLVPSLYSTPIG